MSGPNIGPTRLAELAAEYRKWHRAAATYRHACDKPDTRTMTELLLRESTAAAALLRAASYPTTTTPAGCSSRESLEVFEEAEMTNEALKNLTVEGLAAVAVDAAERTREASRPIAVAMEAAEALAELKGRAADRQDWRHWHSKYIPWAPSRSDFLLKLYRGLPDVRHGEAMAILAAPNLVWAGWLAYRAGVLEEIQQLPELNRGSMLRCVAGGGSTLLEAVPAGPPEGLYRITTAEWVNSASARRLTCADPQNWQDVCEELRIVLQPCDPDSVQLFEAGIDTAVLTPRREADAAD